VLAADPIVGTWKLNLAKSKFNPGPSPKSSTVTYTEEGDWLVLKIDNVTADGKSAGRNSRYKLDGKEYPYESPYGKGTITAKRTGERQVTATVKLEGGNSYTQENVISADSKTRTITITGKNAQGQAMKNTVVYDRQ
ncbi:MAG TPA: hypothetical protein VER03_04975, partial [Bryobacteraceae bacterium]|nr:hypothetical protein [Bryobacteraceae bacterium]